MDDIDDISLIEIYNVKIELNNDNDDINDDADEELDEEPGDNDVDEDLQDDNIIIDSKEEFQNSNSTLDPNTVSVFNLSFDEQVLEIENIKKSEKYLSAPYKCELCAKWWLHEFSLKTHLIRHNKSSGKLLCEVCKQRYLTKKNYRKHVLTHELRFQCKICQKTLSSRASINQHVTKHIGNSPKFICNICGKKSASGDVHRKHMLTHNPVKKFKCPHCPCAFQHSSSRNRHITCVHTEEKTFTCNVCHLIFTDEHSLSLHSQKHSIGKDFYCAECDIIFKSKVTLNEHLKFSSRHGDSKSLTFTCDTCCKRYSNAIKLRRHNESTHLGLKNYKCETCSASFQTPGGLRSHIVIQHEGRARPKNKICPTCKKTFSSNLVLQNHIRIHTGERPYSCHICFTAFRQRASMIKHVNAVHYKFKRDKKKCNRNSA